MSSCCPPSPEESNSCHSSKKTDYVFWAGLFTIAFFYLSYLLSDSIEIFYGYKHISHHFYDLMNKMWWGIGIGALAVGLLELVPQHAVHRIMRGKTRLGGIFKATFAGLLLDLCSHGILMVGVKLHKKGLSTGQLMAFLIASPWNSLSLTIILINMIGWFWTLSFILLSGILAITTGLLFDFFEDKGVLEKTHPESSPEDMAANFSFSDFLVAVPKKPSIFLSQILGKGLKDSQSIIKWLFVGIIIASLLRIFATPEQYANIFGPDLIGLLSTLGLATVVEVCSEGSAPIAADILNRASAPGNAFAFLMAGIATDYTEIMVLKDAFKSWKKALFLPLLCLPQVFLISWLINTFA
ncbi:MAG: permease [Bdellovibrionales bacterium]